MADTTSATLTGAAKAPKTNKNDKAPKAAKVDKAAAKNGGKAPKADKAPKAEKVEKVQGEGRQSKYAEHILTKPADQKENPYREGSMLHIALNTIKSGTSYEKILEQTGDPLYQRYVRRLVRHGNLIATPKK